MTRREKYHAGRVAGRSDWTDAYQRMQSERLARYRIVGRLGAGGMGEVYHFHITGGMSCSLPKIDVFASYVHYAGTDTHVGHAITAGVSVPFER